MTTAEIITIGTELLLGEIHDINTAFIAQQLRSLGIDLYRVTTIGDNTLRIADTIRESLTRADILITTGGLGPTIDDPTRNAVAISLNSDIVFHPELWQTIVERFTRRGITPSENNRKQAYLPEPAIAIDNPVGTAPAFYVYVDNKMIVSLPGVPSETVTIFQESVVPLFKKWFSLNEIIKTRVLHTSGIGESLIDEIIADLESLQNPTVGLSAHPANVDIRITAKSSNELDADRMIAMIESDIRQRLPDAIFGINGENLEQVVCESARQRGVEILLYLYSCDSEIFQHCNKKCGDIFKCEQLNEPFTLVSEPPELEYKKYFAVNFSRDDDLCSAELYYVNENEHDIKVCSYNGPPAQIDRWLANVCMDFIWRKLRA